MAWGLGVQGVVSSRVSSKHKQATPQSYCKPASGSLSEFEVHPCNFHRCFNRYLPFQALLAQGPSSTSADDINPALPIIRNRP